MVVKNAKNNNEGKCPNFWLCPPAWQKWSAHLTVSVSQRALLQAARGEAWGNAEGAYNRVFLPKVEVAERGRG